MDRLKNRMASNFSSWRDFINSRIHDYISQVETIAKEFPDHFLSSFPRIQQIFDHFDDPLNFPNFWKFSSILTCFVGYLFDKCFVPKYRCLWNILGCLLGPQFVGILTIPLPLFLLIKSMEFLHGPIWILTLYTRIGKIGPPPGILRKTRRSKPTMLMINFDYPLDWFDDLSPFAFKWLLHLATLFVFDLGFEKLLILLI